MKVTIYRPNCLAGHGSWRPRRLVDERGPTFPDEYRELLVLEAESIDHAVGQYSSELGDVLLMGEGDELLAYVVGPFGYELVKFGSEWRSPDMANAQKAKAIPFDPRQIVHFSDRPLQRRRQPPRGCLTWNSTSPITTSL